MKYFISLLFKFTFLILGEFVCLFIKILGVRFLFMNFLLISFVAFFWVAGLFKFWELQYIKEITTVAIICCGFFPKVFFFFFAFYLMFFLLWLLGFYSFIYLKILFIYFWLCWAFVATLWLSLVAESGSYSLAVVRGLLIAVTSLVVAHRL